MPWSLPLELGWASAVPFSCRRTKVGEICGKMGVDFRNSKCIFTEPYVGYWMPEREELEAE